jgi:hypothetical protein
MVQSGWVLGSMLRSLEDDAMKMVQGHVQERDCVKLLKS